MPAKQKRVVPPKKQLIRPKPTPKAMPEASRGFRIKVHPEQGCGWRDLYEAEESKKADEWERSAANHPWRIVSGVDRALEAVFRLSERHEKSGQDARCLKIIIARAIRALERAPGARQSMQEASEWPAFVPGGPETGPLRRAWAKEFAKRGVGDKDQSIPMKGKTDYAAGKPAKLARNCFLHLDDLRLSGVNPAWEEMLKAGVVNEPAYQKSARRLPPLSASTTKDWVDASLALLESLNPDWVFWLGNLEGRLQTAKTRSQKKADKGMGYGAGRAQKLDPLVVRIVVKESLTEGYMRLLKD